MFFNLFKMNFCVKMCWYLIKILVWEKENLYWDYIESVKEEELL